MLNPRLPDKGERLVTTVHYRSQILGLGITRERLTASNRLMIAHPILVTCRGQNREISPSQSFVFLRVPQTKPDRMDRKREQRRIRKGSVPTVQEDTVV